MRINVYAEELLDSEDSNRVEHVTTVADKGIIFHGVRIFLHSSDKLHHTIDDDDRSAVTFWGPKHKVATLLRQAAEAMDGNKV